MKAAPESSMYSMPDETRYWADCASEDLPDTIIAKAMRYRERLMHDGRLDLQRRAERTYYGQDAEGGMANSSAVAFGGEQGELVMFRVNEFRSILQGMIALAVSKRPAFDPRATNTDAESARQVTIARSLLEAYMRIADYETKRRVTALASLLFGEGYTALRWNVHAGRIVGRKQIPDPLGGTDDNGQPKMVTIAMHEGDLEAHCFNPIEVIHQLDKDESELEWAIVAYRDNVFDLAARYPEHADKLRNLRGSSQQRWPRSAWGASPFEYPQMHLDVDIVTTWWLYHKPTDALPEGRHAIVCGEVTLYDGPLPFDEVPVYRLMPEWEVATARGHSPMFDLLAIQQVYDAAMDMRATAHDSSQPMLAMPKGTDISPEQVGNKARMLEYTPNPDAPNAGLPSVLNLSTVDQTSNWWIEMLPHTMERLSGINSVVRGDPMPQLKSGAALALVQSLAVQYNTPFQSSVVRHDERVATGMIKILKRFATGRREVELVGRSQRGAMMEWSQDDLATVARVTIEVGSALQDTTAGRAEIAQQLLDKGLVKTPEEFVEALTTGRVEPVIKGPKAKLDLINDENELLANPDEWDREQKRVVGLALKAAAPRLQQAQQAALTANPNDPMAVQAVSMQMQQAQQAQQAAAATLPVTAKATDDHGLHILEHTALLSSPTVRFDPVLSERVMQHILEHEQKLTQMDPFLAQLTQQSVMPPPPPPMLPPPGAPMPHGGKPVGLEPPSPHPNKARPLGGEPPPSGPHMPRNPMTGQPAPNPAAT